MRNKNRFNLIDFGLQRLNLLDPWLGFRSKNVFNLSPFSFPSIYPYPHVRKPLKTGLLDMNLNPWAEFANLLPKSTRSKSANPFGFSINSLDTIAFSKYSDIAFTISPMQEMRLYLPKPKYIAPVYYSDPIPVGLTESVITKADIKDFREMSNSIEEWVAKRKARKEVAMMKLKQLEEDPGLYDGVPKEEIPKVRRKILKTLIREIQQRETEPPAVKRIRAMANVTKEEKYKVKEVIAKEQTKEGLKEKILKFYRNKKNEEQS